MYGFLVNLGDSIDRRGHEPTLQPAYRDRLTVRPGSGGWRRDPHVVLRHEGQNRPTVGGSRVFSSLLDNVLDNSNRRQYGMGWVGRMFGYAISLLSFFYQNPKISLGDQCETR